jgi:hypothetical protein
MQVIIYTQNNGQMAICTPTGELSIEEVLAKDCPANAIIVDSESLPNEHYDLFNAWELADGVTTVNFEKSVKITKDRLRAERIALLEAQDVAFQRALETGADTAAIVTEKQRLRDITNFTATTLDELKALKAGV